MGTCQTQIQSDEKLQTLLLELESKPVYQFSEERKLYKGKLSITNFIAKFIVDDPLNNGSATFKDNLFFVSEQMMDTSCISTNDVIERLNNFSFVQKNLSDYDKVAKILDKTKKMIIPPNTCDYSVLNENVFQILSKIYILPCDMNHKEFYDFFRENNLSMSCDTFLEYVNKYNKNDFTQKMTAYLSERKNGFEESLVYKYIFENNNTCLDILNLIDEFSTSGFYNILGNLYSSLSNLNIDYINRFKNIYTKNRIKNINDDNYGNFGNNTNNFLESDLKIPEYLLKKISNYFTQNGADSFLAFKIISDVNRNIKNYDYSPEKITLNLHKNMYNMVKYCHTQISNITIENTHVPDCIISWIICKKLCFQKGLDYYFSLVYKSKNTIFEKIIKNNEFKELFNNDLDEYMERQNKYDPS
jgi:hypothetical protein